MTGPSFTSQAVGGIASLRTHLGKSALSLLAVFSGLGGVLGGGVMVVPLGAMVVAQEPQTAGETQPPASEQPLQLSRIDVVPQRPQVDSLCRLSVVLDNRSERPIYALGFDVRINGAELPVYRDQLFVQKLPAGEQTVVQLFNFWTNETGRPVPDDGKLVVEVTVREAEFLSESTESTETAETGQTAETAERAEGTAADEAEQTQVWSPDGAVPGLPVSSRQVIELDLTKGR